MEPQTSSILDNLYKSIQTFGSLKMAAESRDKLYRYNDAFMQSLHSILTDCDCDEATKLETFNTSLEQYAAAMKDLFPQLISGKEAIADESPKENTVSKADPNRFDQIVEVEKFNPYHDERGRFSQANSATLFTYRTKDPNKQHWADNAIAREKERDAAGLNGPPSTKKPTKQPTKETKPKNPLGNPKTISGVERGEPMSREEANSGNANPNYDQGGGYRVNCQTCVVAYEARLRGYDVQAKPLGDDPTQRALMRNPQLAWEDPKTGRLASSIGGGDSITTPQKCREWMEKAVEPGARYALENVWKGRGTTAHIISCDKDSSGNLRFYDPQSGKTYQGSDIDSYLSRCKYEANVWGTKVNVSPRLTRIDNMAFNTDVANTAVEVAK